MSLLTYDDAVAAADQIKDKVSQRLMPPWHIDKTVGIQEFKNDRSLTDDEIADDRRIGSTTARRWAIASDLPAARKFPDPNRWQLADKLGTPPDLDHPVDAVHARRAHAGQVVPADRRDGTHRAALGARDRSEAGACRRIGRSCITRSRISFRTSPKSRASPARRTTISTNAGLFMEWAVGKTGQIFAPDAGKLMLPGSQDPLGSPLPRDRRGDTRTARSSSRSTSIRRASCRSIARC